MGKKNGTARYNEAEYVDFWRKCDGDDGDDGDNGVDWYNTRRTRNRWQSAAPILGLVWRVYSPTYQNLVLKVGRSIPTH